MNRFIKRNFHFVMAALALVAILIGCCGVYVSWQNYKKLDRNYAAQEQVVEIVKKNGNGSH